MENWKDLFFFLTFINLCTISVTHFYGCDSPPPTPLHGKVVGMIVHPLHPVYSPTFKFMCLDNYRLTGSSIIVCFYRYWIQFGNCADEISDDICLGSSTSSPSPMNNRPIIGVVMQKVSKTDDQQALIVANYVKYLEMAGARVVPIFVKMEEDYYPKIFSSINGLLFPGGSLNEELLTSGYGEVGRKVYNYTIERCDAGDYFPVWGTCQGFQLLASLAADEIAVENLPVEDENLSLNFSGANVKSSRLFRYATDEIINIFEKMNVTYNIHNLSLSEKTYARNNKINSMFKVITTNEAAMGTFISTFEAYEYPFYGVQWHPEKNIFEWGNGSHPNHFQEAVLISQYMANFFVNEARKSSHHFESWEEEKGKLIYQYPVSYSGDKFPFDQAYYFDVASGVGLPKENVNFASIHDIHG